MRGKNKIHIRSHEISYSYPIFGRGMKFPEIRYMCETAAIVNGRAINDIRFSPQSRVEKMDRSLTDTEQERNNHKLARGNMIDELDIIGAKHTAFILAQPAVEYYMV